MAENEKLIKVQIHILLLLLTVLLFSCGCMEVKDDICMFRIYSANASIEQMIDGELVASKEGMYVNTSSKQSYVSRGKNNTWEWAVSIYFNQENACRFGKIAQKSFFGVDNPKNRPVDMFINRPLNSTLLVSKMLYLRIYYAKDDNPGSKEAILWDDPALFFLEKRAKMPVIVYTEDNPGEIRNNLTRYLEMGYTNVIITEDVSVIPLQTEAIIAESGMKSERRNISGEDIHSWLKEMTGLANSVRINFDTRGECIYSAQIIGYAETDDEAEKMAEDIACAFPHSAADKARIYPG